ncbi:MAG: sugar transferase [Pseudomonadota bacterium]|nr:sugar transferase [Pseudomonadota bacterium]
MPVPGYRFKRHLDIVLSISIIVLALPVFFFGLFITLLEGHRPIFTQRRLGLHCKEFTIYKFRTMKSPPKGHTPYHHKPNAPELTRIGRFLRNTSIDELPQLFNVLKGDMSLVGPRPHAIEFANHYASIAPRYYERYRVRPGLACIVEVTALHYRTERPKDIRSRINCDLYYIKHLSFGLDILIFLRILRCVLTPQPYKPTVAQDDSAKRGLPGYVACDYKEMGNS